VEIRQARADEIPYLQARLAETEGEQINLNTARTWVAVEDGKLIGMLPLRMAWQAEPLHIFPEVTRDAQRRRAGLLMYRAATSWIADRSQNKTGIHWLFGITRSKAVAGWLTKLGWHQQYIGAKTFLKYF
jgi:N-acetylglutamate synthase-like GNAT family acetyltransferase